MIIIDHDKCNLCRVCEAICHEYCINIENDTLTIDYKYCSTCTQCIAICPRKALSWDNVKPESFNKSLYPSPDQIDELLRERRTIRDYTGRGIDRSILEEITEYLVYAPTHNFNFRIMIIDDEQMIEFIDSIILKFALKTYKWFYSTPIIYSLLKIFTPSREHEYLKAKPKLEAAERRKSGFKTKPAAIIVIIGDKRIPLSLESAQYALYNMDLYAQTRGLACRNLVGNQRVINRNKQFRRMAGLKPEERIFGILTLGYAAVKFKNKVDGKKPLIQWNDIKERR